MSKKQLIELAEQFQVMSEVITEHNKNFAVMLENISVMNDELISMRSRLGDLEAKVAYYTAEKPLIVS
jgi:hypothetical protein